MAQKINLVPDLAPEYASNIEILKIGANSKIVAGSVAVSAIESEGCNHLFTYLFIIFYAFNLY